MVDNVIHDSALALQTKVDILAWIGLIPEPLSSMTQLEVRMYRTALTDPEANDDLKKKTVYLINGLHKSMNEGVNVIMKKLNTDTCVECGKCDNLKEVLQSLLDGDDIHGIIHKIQSQFGDIEGPSINRMPGEPERNPIEEILSGRVENPGAEMLNLLKMIASEDPLTIKMKGDVIPKNLLDAIFGETPDKDKLH